MLAIFLLTTAALNAAADDKPAASSDKAKAPQQKAASDEKSAKRADGKKGYTGVRPESERDFLSTFDIHRLFLT
jgi:hypothetical protein